jgi:hypothetical protein
MMDFEIEPPRPNWDGSPVEVPPDERLPIYDALAREGLSYSRGGHVRVEAKQVGQVFRQLEHVR